MESSSCFIKFIAPIDDFSLPEKFNYPFNYEPHPLCRLAAKELQDYIENQTEWVHSFWEKTDDVNKVMGKMFGILLVKNEQGELGYLAAFSGKLAGKNQHPLFVPPIFDMLDEEGFFRKEEEQISAINHQIDALENAPDFLEYQRFAQGEESLAQQQIDAAKQIARAAKKNRHQQRIEAKEKLSPQDLARLEEQLVHESKRSHFELKDLNKYWKNRLAQNQKNLQVFTQKIETLKQERKERSAALQQQLFDQYQFLNITGKLKNLGEIFVQTAQKIPPAGAGECAAPKLLQFAFQHNLEPLALAEFWWGQSPKSFIRKQGQFYPSCRGKCEPILAHMLDGMIVEENPMLTNPALGKELKIVYEDAWMVAVNKPADFLSVPGKNIEDSVFTRMQQRYPDATGPLVVHRLDMSTSGILLIAKSKEAHHYLQQQFINRNIQKCYVALLEGNVEKEEGLIDLPLRVDLDNRPQQMVCYDYGKAAQTKWKVIKRSPKHTRIYFYPITGRTHQLRVHAAHPLGLNCPILGDDLYGNRAKRLYLHAEKIAFQHPHTKERMSLEILADF